MNEPVNEPTPEEAAAALRAVHEGRQRVISSAMGSRWLWIASGLIVFLYSAGIDLFPAVATWLNLAIVVVILGMVVTLRTRKGSALIGRQVTLSSRGLPAGVTWRLVRIAPVFVIGIAVALTVQLFHVPHGTIYYGALAGLYIGFLGPRFQLWLLRRQDKDFSGGRA